MKTEGLIALLARGAGPAPRAAVARRLGPALALGLAASCALALGLLGPIPTALWADPVPWLKLGYAAALAAAAAWLAGGLSRPASPVAAAARAVAGVVAAMGLLGLVAWLRVPAPERMQALLGHSWWFCPLVVFALALPALAAAFWAMRGLAPTRLRAAGFAAGLAAGAVGAFGYALACQELTASFVAVWYTLGILAAGGLGALLGPRWLRW